MIAASTNIGDLKDTAVLLEDMTKTPDLACRRFEPSDLCFLVGNFSACWNIQRTNQPLEKSRTEYKKAVGLWGSDSEDASFIACVDKYFTPQHVRGRILARELCRS
jgi:hypothetical protein